jgi:hypothetical protein
MNEQIKYNMGYDKDGNVPDSDPSSTMDENRKKYVGYQDLVRMVVPIDIKSNVEPLKVNYSVLGGQQQIVKYRPRQVLGAGDGALESMAKGVDSFLNDPSVMIMVIATLIMIGVMSAK